MSFLRKLSRDRPESDDRVEDLGEVLDLRACSFAAVCSTARATTLRGEEVVSLLLTLTESTRDDEPDCSFKMLRPRDSGEVSIVVPLRGFKTGGEGGSAADIVGGRVLVRNTSWPGEGAIGGRPYPNK